MRRGFNRFDSDLRIDLHDLGDWADGAFTCEFTKQRPSMDGLPLEAQVRIGDGHRKHLEKLV